MQAELQWGRQQGSHDSMQAETPLCVVGDAHL